MTSDSALPVACPRCSSLLIRGAVMCRVCSWSAQPTEELVGAGAGALASAGVGRTAAGHAFSPPRDAPRYADIAAARSAAGAARAAGILAWLVCVAGALVFLFTLLAERALNSMFAHSLNAGSAQLQYSATKTLGIVAVVGIAAFVQLGLYVAAGVMTAIWSVRARSVAVGRGHHPQRYSETWTVLGWFVPFASLWIPFQVVGDIWHGSQPDTNGRGQISAGLVIGWWAAFLGSGVLAFLARPNHGQGSTLVMVCAIALQCGAAFMFVNMLTKVTAWQQALAQNA